MEYEFPHNYLEDTLNKIFAGLLRKGVAPNTLKRRTDLFMTGKAVK